MTQKNKIKQKENVLKYCDVPEVTRVEGYRNDWVIVNGVTGEIVDNGDGWGYTTRAKAINHWEWKYGKNNRFAINSEADMNEFIKKHNDLSFLSSDSLEKEYEHISELIGFIETFMKKNTWEGKNKDRQPKNMTAAEYAISGELNALECSMISYQSMLSAILTLRDPNSIKRQGDS